MSDVEDIRQLVTSRAWTEFFVPGMLRRRNTDIYLLVNPTEERRKTASDDLLRARIQVLDELIAVGPAVIAEWDTSQAAEEEALTYKQNVHDRAELGRIGPFDTD